MKKLLNPKIIMGACLLFSSASLLASCSKNSTKTFDVTFYNGETVLKVEKVEEESNRLDTCCRRIHIPRLVWNTYFYS